MSVTLEPGLMRNKTLGVVMTRKSGNWRQVTVTGDVYLFVDDLVHHR